MTHVGDSPPEIGRYCVREQIGVGGIGVVDSAHVAGRGLAATARDEQPLAQIEAWIATPAS